jgi:glyoxylase-like metal-dependent hydrolase (beta-lactamase superfamily II)
MLFEQIATGGCQSYLIARRDKCVAALIDPEISQLDRYQGLLTQHGLRLRYVIDTHTHADHFSASHHLGRTLNVPVVHHHLSPAPFADMRLDDGDILIIGTLRLQAIRRTHARLHVSATRRPIVHRRYVIDRRRVNRSTTGDAEQLYDSLFNRILKLDPALKVFPAHDYKARFQHDWAGTRQQSAFAEA